MFLMNLLTALLRFFESSGSLKIDEKLHSWFDTPW
jgi:hypothetical protein